MTNKDRLALGQLTEQVVLAEFHTNFDELVETQYELLDQLESEAESKSLGKLETSKDHDFHEVDREDKDGPVTFFNKDRATGHINSPEGFDSFSDEVVRMINNDHRFLAFKPYAQEIVNMFYKDRRAHAGFN